MKWVWRIGIALLALIIIAVLLKPNYSRFKEFAAEGDAGGMYQFSTRRTADYLVYSLYEKKIYVRKSKFRYILARTETYAGYLLNFHLISNVENWRDVK